MPTRPSELRGRTSRESGRVGQALRRMAVQIAADALCKLIGFTDDAGNQEEDDEADLFHGVGTFARPPKGKGAAFVIQAGAKSGSAVVVATRDIETLLAVLGKRAVGDDEAMFYNSMAGLHVKANGELELRSHDGTAAAGATLEDVYRIWRFLYAQFAATGGHTHLCASPGSPTTTIATVPPAAEPLPPAAIPPTPAVPPQPVGTKKVKVE